MNKQITLGLLTTFAFASVTPVASAAPFKRDKTLSLQFVHLGTVGDPAVAATHADHQERVDDIRDVPDADLSARFAPYLNPTFYNTVVVTLRSDGTASVLVPDPGSGQAVAVVGTYVRSGRNLAFSAVDPSRGYDFTFIGKASKQNKKCYQGTAESKPPGFETMPIAAYWEGCR